MLTESQKRDAEECEDMEQNSQTKECKSCSCNCCIAQESVEFKPGLNLAKEIIESEMEFTKEINSQMAMGMSQVLMLINKEIEKQ